MFYIISTPIGNLDDLSFRAVETLRALDFLVCEDTRVTSVLLRRHDISLPLISLNAQSEKRKILSVLAEINQGKTGGLVSDAGTPSISDPGAMLVNELISAGVELTHIPGPSALLTGLLLSGFPAHHFDFRGFIPQKKGRKTFLEGLVPSENTTVFYESVHRIEKLIHELAAVIPQRQIAVCRELTKMFEETWRGSAEEMCASLPSKKIKGEFVVVIAPAWWRGEHSAGYSEE